MTKPAKHSNHNETKKPEKEEQKPAAIPSVDERLAALQKAVKEAFTHNHFSIPAELDLQLQTLAMTEPQHGVPPQAPEQ